MNAAPKPVDDAPAKPRGTTVATGKPGPGRPVGSVNKTSATLRTMLGLLAEFNVGHVQAALDAVRNGVKGPVTNRHGNVVLDENGKPIEGFIVQPDPGKFADLYIKLVEFAAPKLQRSEVVTKDGGADIEPIAATATPEEATRAYIKMVKG